jgi:predicted aspartyl protease
MRLSLQDNLPFVNVILTYNSKKVEIQNVLVDTGSGGTIFSSDDVAKIGIVPQSGDILRHVHGIGGSEVVFMRLIESIQVGDYVHTNFEIEVGGMDYGFGIRGLLGMDFLVASGAEINLQQLRIDFNK